MNFKPEPLDSKKICILFVALVALSACSTSERRLSDAQGDAYIEQILAERAPQSLQYAELIGPSTYRIYNIFRMHDGRVTDLGRSDIAVGQVIERKGLPGATFTQMQMEITGVEGDQLFLRSVWFEKDGQIVDWSGSLPIRKLATEQLADDGNSEKPSGIERK